MHANLGITFVITFEGIQYLLNQVMVCLRRPYQTMPRND